MPKANRQHIRRALTHKKRRNYSSIFLCLSLGLLIVLIGVSWIMIHARPLNNGIWLDTTYKVTGPPSIGADFINQVFDTYDSPASGKGQALYDLGVKYHIDPVYALAFFLQESRLGTTGVARVTLSLGNIRATPGYESYHGYRKYKTWEAGFEDWYKLIAQQYVREWKLSTVDQIIPVYAPSSDHNDVEAYIQSVKNAVDGWRLGELQV